VTIRLPRPTDRYDSQYMGRLLGEIERAVAGAGGGGTLDGLRLYDTDGSHALTISLNSNLTAERTLQLITGDADRVLTLSGDATISGTNSGDQTITLTGDVTGSGTGSFAATIGNDKVTYAKMQNVSAGDKVLGRVAGSGDVEEIAFTSAARDLADDADAAAQRATLGMSYGKQTVWVPAGAMVPRITNGAALGTVEMATNKNMIKTLDFDPTTQEFAQFDIRMPKSWNESTVSFIPVWSHPATATNFGTVWGLDAVAVSDDDALDVAFGTEQTSTDTGGTTNDLYQGPESSAITIAGTPAEGDLVMFRIHRNPAAGSDTLTVDARLHGIVLLYTNNAGNDS